MDLWLKRIRSFKSKLSTGWSNWCSCKEISAFCCRPWTVAINHLRATSISFQCPVSWELRRSLERRAKRRIQRNQQQPWEFCQNGKRGKWALLWATRIQCTSENWIRRYVYINHSSIKKLLLMLLFTIFRLPICWTWIWIWILRRWIQSASPKLKSVSSARNSLEWWIMRCQPRWFVIWFI